MSVTESAHAPQRAEVVIERTVLPHEDHDVFYVLDRPGLRDGLRPAPDAAVTAGRADPAAD